MALLQRTHRVNKKKFKDEYKIVIAPGPNELNMTK